MVVPELVLKYGYKLDQNLTVYATELVAIQIYQNMVTLHFKLNGIMNAATWWQVFYPQTPPPPPTTHTLGQKVIIHFFPNNVLLHIKLKGITNAATWLQIFSP